jgi:hypothetical protein
MTGNTIGAGIEPQAIEQIEIVRALQSVDEGYQARIGSLHRQRNTDLIHAVLLNGVLFKACRIDR